MKKMLALSLALASLALAAAANAAVVAVGTTSSGVTVALNDSTTSCPYNRGYTASNGASGCWNYDSTYRRYVLTQKRPTAGLSFLYPSQVVVCPPDTADASECLAAQ